MQSRQQKINGPRTVLDAIRLQFECERRHISRAIHESANVECQGLEYNRPRVKQASFVVGLPTAAQDWFEIRM